MEQTKQDQILQAILGRNGTTQQMDMCTEECAELIQAINKIKRLGGLANGGSRVLRPGPGTDIKYSLAYYSLCSEVADVKIMICQMERMLDKEAIDIAVERKITRSAERMNIK